VTAQLKPVKAMTVLAPPMLRWARTVENMRRAKKALERDQVRGRLSQARGSRGSQRRPNLERMESSGRSRVVVVLGADVDEETRKGRATEVAKETRAW
jgi:hypothetical protein